MHMAIAYHLRTPAVTAPLTLHRTGTDYVQPCSLVDRGSDSEEFKIAITY